MFEEKPSNKSILIYYIYIDIWLLYILYPYIKINYVMVII